jgi:hypothetical protein
MITFRVGAYDAEILEKEFAPAFTAEDLVNLGFKQIYLKLMIDGVSSQPFSAETLPPIAKPESSSLEEVIDNSRKLYAEPKAKVEEAIALWHESGKTPKPALKEDGQKKQYDTRDSAPKSFRSDQRSSRTSEASRAARTPAAPQAIDTRGLNSRREKEKVSMDMPPAEDGFKPLKAISLEELKKKSNNQREPSKENLSELRSILSTLTKGEVSKVEDKKKPHTSQAPAQKIDNRPDRQKSESKDKIKEVSEADLKSLFGIEN